MPLDSYLLTKSLETSDMRRMNGKAGTPRRRERVVFETERHTVVGDVTLPPEGYQSRFSDAINRPDVAFIPLVDVEITPHDGMVGVRHDFITLAKAHVRFAYPLEGAEPRA
jgi:uncharacterized protein DUF6812